MGLTISCKSKDCRNLVRKNIFEICFNDNLCTSCKILIINCIESYHPDGVCEQCGFYNNSYIDIF